jgi:hypothetical protein
MRPNGEIEAVLLDGMLVACVNPQVPLRFKNIFYCYHLDVID